MRLSVYRFGGIAAREAISRGAQAIHARRVHVVRAHWYLGDIRGGIRRVADRDGTARRGKRSAAGQHRLGVCTNLLTTDIFAVLLTSD